MEKWKFKFKDGERTVFNIAAEVTERNGYPEFTISGDGGQVVDQINYDTDAQEKLVKIWKMWHLNGSSAGTPEQNEILKTYSKDKLRSRIEELRDQINDAVLLNLHEGEEMAKDLLKIHDLIDAGAKIIAAEKVQVNDYDTDCTILKLYEMFEVPHPTTGEPYKYGHGTIKRTIPEDFEQMFTELVEELESEEPEDVKVSELVNSGEHYDEIAELDDQVLALAVSEDLHVSELEEIEECYEYHYKYGGTEYFVGTPEEAIALAEQYMKDEPYFWQEAVKTEQTTLSLDDYCTWVVEVDGAAHILNSWDGNSDEVDINDTTYEIIRRG